MKFTYFIGIDVSKSTLDVILSCKTAPQTFTHQQFANNVTGGKQMLSWLRKHKVKTSEAFFIMEHTGWYTLELCCFLQEKNLAFALFSPLHLKRSLGLVRGKNDKVDAKRLAYYAFLHRHELKAVQLPSACLLKLKNLFAFRDRLIKTQTSLRQTIQDLKDTSHLIDNKFIIKESEKQLKLIQQQVQQTEAQITATIKEDDLIKTNFKLLTSVPGIGLVTAVAVILCTQNFTAFDDGRKFASYCGVAPFEYNSGSSIRGKTQTSPLANKRIKALLSNCASTAIQHDEELRIYYLRKTKQGKANMVALNAVRAKLINRMFATIKRGSEYVVFKQYGQAA
jgi:transposase